MGKTKVYEDNRIELRHLVSDFLKDHTLEKYKILESYIQESERSYCGDCGDSIYYEGRSRIRVKTGTNIMQYDKNQPTCKTIKEANGKDFYLSICENCLSKKFPKYHEMNPSRIFNTLNDICCYAFGIPEEDRKEKTKELAITKNGMIKKYGEKEGLEKWKNYCKVQGETNTFEYKKEKYGWTQEDFKDFNKSRAVTRENLVNRHGKEKGDQMFDDYVKKQRTNGKTLKWFIDTYGENIGREKYKKVGIGKASSGMISGITVSKVSNEFFKILSKFTNYYIKSDINGGEKIIYIDELDKCYILDGYIEELKVCIEFQGDYYHANPNKYDEFFEFPEFTPENVITLTSKDLWRRDKIKKEALMKYMGIRTIEIWESDFYKNRNNEEFYKEIVNKIIEK